MTFFHQTPYLVSLSKDAVDECIATVNMGTLVIPHPTADDQPKCIACKTGVSLHMVMPKNLVEGNRYELDFCNRLHVLVAEAEGEIFIDNPASCVCPALRYATALDCESCFSKKRAKDRTGAMCNRGVVSISELDRTCWGTTKEYMSCMFLLATNAQRRRERSVPLWDATNIH